MTDVQAADAALGAAIRLRGMNIIEKFTDVKTGQLLEEFG